MRVRSVSIGAETSTSRSKDHHTIDVAADGGIDDGAASPATERNTNENMNQRLIGDDNKTSKRKIIGLTFSWVYSEFRSFIIDPITKFNQIFNFHPDDQNEDCSCICLYKAASRGEWKTAEEMEQKDPGILSRVISEDRKETALHIATRFNKAAFVEKLVKKLSKEDLEATNVYGNTALCIAATLGAVDIAKSLLEKHKDLLGNATPVLIAARYKHKIMVVYLLTEMDSILLSNMKDDEQMELLLSVISADYYDVALDILKRNESLALKSDINGDTPLHIMARKSNAIASYKKTTKWQSYAKNKSCWFKCIFKRTTMQIKAREMVEMMWEIGLRDYHKLMNHFIDGRSNMLHEAARVGNVEFLEVLLDANPKLLRIFDHNGKSIFHVAVENRQEGVFNLIYDMKLFNVDDLLHYFDEEKISLLELAAKKADPTHLDRVSGAVFQMHSELLWFKEVEKIEGLTTRPKTEGVQTASKLFSQEHRELKEEGEKWVKKTANSCMLVATLIATVSFAAAFTVPGGKNETNGIPIFLNHKWFTVFVISDGMAMLSSSTSILLFLSVLTSRCAENDFLFWLPLELVCGLGTLFVSVWSMVLAFGASFFLYYGKGTTNKIPLFITGMAVGPIFWFCVLQWKLWANALVSLHSTAMSCWARNRKTGIVKKVTRGVCWKINFGEIGA